MDFISFLQLDTFQPSDLLTVGVLIILEGLLSCDNAVVLALLVKDLPPEQRGRALRYGIIGAYVFRIIALLLAVWIMSQWYLKVLGGIYLAWLGVSFFLKKKHHDADGAVAPRPPRRWFGLSAFWSTVMAVELTDIVFSVDSIAAAVALSDKLWILVAGALLGILAMRFAAQGFVKLLASFPRLEACAFIAVAFIGFKLLLEMPGDVIGLSHAFPPQATYRTAQEYHAAVEEHCPPWAHMAHTFTINSAAAPEPEAWRFLGDGELERTMGSLPTAERDKVRDEIEAAMRQHGAERTVTVQGRSIAVHADQQRQFEVARSDWNLHLRPLIEIEGWLSSLVVLLIFAAGFLRPAKAKAGAGNQGE